MISNKENSKYDKKTISNEELLKAPKQGKKIPLIEPEP